jgi:dienelactone hydrolase
VSHGELSVASGASGDLGGWPLEQRLALWGLARHTPNHAMLLDFIEAQAQALVAKLPKPDTLTEWQQRAAEITPLLLHSLGLEDLNARTPLNAKVVGKIERAGYSIEKLVYEPRPGFPTSAHLYLPSKAHFPAPAVLYAAGHWMENAKLHPDVQLCCANLARLGFVTLVYDPIGQGERLGDWLDHGHIEPLLVGLSQEGLMVFESIRALDYLVSRPEVDSGCIGMTGSSGGGLNTFYTSAIDSRIQVSIPVCYVTTFYLMMASERDRNWEDGMDLCNQVPAVMAYAEMSDILGLFAPKPLRMITAVQDTLFPVEGTRQIYQKTQALYQLHGAQDRVDLVEVDAPHGYDQAMRQAAYGWFVRWLQGEGDGQPIAEQACELVPLPYPAELERPRRRGGQPADASGLCFPPGQGARSGAAITVLASQKSDSLLLRRATATDINDWTHQRRQILDRIPSVIGPWPERTPISKNRIFNRVQTGNVIAERVVFDSEAGIEVPALFFRPNQWKAPSPVIVYLDEWGKETGLANGMIEALLATQFAVLALDVRGVGETAASEFEATTNALMTDRPLFGQRVWDVLEAVRRLRQGGYVSGFVDRAWIGCIGRGAGALLALYAAALEESVAAVSLWQSPISYHSLNVERPDFPPSLFLFDVLHHFDLPDLMATLAPRPLLLADPVDGYRQPLAEDKITNLCAQVTEIYSTVQPQAGRWQFLAGLEKPCRPQEIAQWLWKAWRQ